MDLTNPIPHDDPNLSRSIIVQKLSQLVGFLEHIGPTAPNGDLCHSVKCVVRHVLDQELNRSNPSAVQQVYPAAMSFPAGWNDFQFFSFDLMDTFDWVRPDIEVQPMQQG